MGMINDMFVESKNDEEKYMLLVSQDDMDRF